MSSWTANLKAKLGRHLIMPFLAIAMVGSFVTYDFVKAMPARARRSHGKPYHDPAR